MPAARPSRFSVGVAIAAMTALSACNTTKPSQDSTGIDDRYGIPPLSVPPHLLESNGFMSNGLLPAQPYD
jgi:hypothetical protein